ncbi:MAG: hypothetical protein ABSF53_12385 [Terracidiphilus sp.]
MRSVYGRILTLAAMASFTLSAQWAQAQAALLLEEPYGFFGTMNPTGHTAIYFEHICAESPVKLRPCEPGEPGAVIARYQGMTGYDWIAIPLVPYLYAVDSTAQVPNRADRHTVDQLRSLYHEDYLLPALGENLHAGSLFQGGWSQLAGVAYDRRIYAFRFATTEEQDDALIARLNSGKNRSHFDLFYNNCADFARTVLNFYYPRTFRRSFFPDAGMTTPKQIASKLARYARKHPDMHLSVFEISQVPGYRHRSHFNKSVAESLATTIYAVPILLVNPYIAGGLFVDYLARGRFNPVPRTAETLDAMSLSALTAPAFTPQNQRSASFQAAVVAGPTPAESQVEPTSSQNLKEMKAEHE